ncbi:MAG: phosphoserine phosphatase SerB [Stappiaceae bacterium]
MSHVVTLVANPTQSDLTPELAASLAQHLPGFQTPVFLHEGIAVDIPFKVESTGNLKSIEVFLREKIGAIPVDIIVQRRDTRRKSLLIADMDSTMIGQECIDELAAELGIKQRIAAITERAMRGEIEFEPALRERVSLLKGLNISIVDQVIDNRITLTPGGRELVQTMKANGGYCALVSGGFTVFTGHIAETIGFDENRANTLLAQDNILTGLVGEPILGQEAKRDRLHALVREHGLALSQTLAVGDGANDLAMIRDAGIGIAFHAKPAVAAEADARIDHGDLTALLYAQGYSREEFVAD